MTFNGWLISREPNIMKLGYVESNGKKGLFYKQCTPGVAFLDHRIDDDFPYKQQYEEGPRYYFKLAEPKWKSIRNKRFEEQFLREHKIKFSLPIIDRYESISDETGRPEDGFCHFCKKDFQDKGFFCSVECERDFKNQTHELCRACQEPIEGKVTTRHHTSYYPEEIITVHQSCHLEIHRSTKYLHLRPADSDKDKFYKND